MHVGVDPLLRARYAGSDRGHSVYRIAEICAGGDFVIAVQVYREALRLCYMLNFGRFNIHGTGLTTHIKVFIPAKVPCYVIYKSWHRGVFQEYTTRGRGQRKFAILINPSLQRKFAVFINP